MLSLLRRPSTREAFVVYDAMVKDGKYIAQVMVPTYDNFKKFSGTVSESKEEAELSAAKAALFGLLVVVMEQLKNG